MRRPLLAERLAEFGVPDGPGRGELAQGRSVRLADGRLIVPEMVQGPQIVGTRLVVVGDVEEVASLPDEVRGADALVIEATFLDRDQSLARERGHLTAATAAWLALEAGVGELLLTHISGRYRPEEISAEAVALFPRTKVVADFDRIKVAARPTPADPAI